MSQLTARNLRGVWATVLLDVTPDGDIRLDAINRQVTAFARAGMDGVYCNGTASEFHCQTDIQFRQVAEATMAAARAAGLPVQIGASHPLAQGSLARICDAAALGPDAIQITLPDWTPIDRATAIRFLSACAEAAGGCPLVLYNPPHSRTVLTPDDLRAVVDAVPRLIGLKSGGGQPSWYRAMAAVFDRLSVFVPGHRYASGRAQGAHGAYSNMACLDPAGAVRWARLSTEDPGSAAEVETRIDRFMAAAIHPLLAAGFPGYAIDKAMAAAGGWAGLTPRLLWPHRGVPDDAVARIAVAAIEHLPDFTRNEQS
ncbi:MAG: dihydrodipicolinate synthase family protein [Inquilinaceae bacterium]